jgi:hypothetical protein
MPLHRTVSQIDLEISKIHRAIESTLILSDVEMLAKHGIIPVPQASIDEYVAAQRVKLVELKAEAMAVDAVACRRCLGTGIYSGLSRHVRNGQPSCFGCDGSGYRKGAA